MNKRKELPDHSNKAYADTNVTIPNEFIEHIAEKFRFDCNFDLEDELKIAWLWYNTAQSILDSRYPISETRELLSKFSASAWSLQNCLDKFGPEEHRLLEMGFYSLTNDEPQFSQVVFLAQAADDALSSMPKSKGGSKLQAETPLTRRLYNVFTRGSTQKTTISYSDIEERYKGPVVDFACDCMKIMGVPKLKRTNLGIGKKLSRIRLEKKKSNK